MNWELGEPKSYDAGRTPLSESTIWPDCFTDREAERFARLVEDMGGARLGAVACPQGEHWMMGDPEPIPIEPRFRCPKCRAEP